MAVTTRATATLQGLADSWVRLYPSAVFAGIVGDLSHSQRGGYHISIRDQVDDQNYSVVRPDDKAPPGDWARDCAAAIDINLGLADMKVCHGRLTKVWRDRQSDPRAKYINAHNGWDGEGNAGRYDWVAGAVKAATDDHKWHVHLEIRRRYVDDPKAAAAILSILRGETVQQYLGTNTEAAVAFVDETIPVSTTTGTELFEPDKPSGTQVAAHTILQLAAIHAGRAARNTGSLATKLDEISAKLDALAVQDGTDEQAIVTGVLAGLSPEAIADAVVEALPADVAQQVVDELASRLGNTEQPPPAPEV